MSPEGRPVRCGGWAMNEALDTVLAEITSWRWQEDRPYFTLNRKAREAWAEGFSGGSREPPKFSAWKIH